MRSKRGVFAQSGHRLEGPGRFLHETHQSAQARALLRAVLFSRFPDLDEATGTDLKTTVTLHTRADDETLQVEWDQWVIGTLGPAAAEIAKLAMRKQGNRTYMATEVSAEIIVRAGNPQVWIDLPEPACRD